MQGQVSYVECRGYIVLIWQTYFEGIVPILLHLWEGAYGSWHDFFLPQVWESFLSDVHPNKVSLLDRLLSPVVFISFHLVLPVGFCYMLMYLLM